ncbi:MAG: PAS domain S-box protein [Myxococcales bacterium FL481]|nr:MAG: PAS domain S-box protein [Myxococcales bacterium FL481]
MVADDELSSLRREVERLRGRVAQLEREADLHENAPSAAMREREELLAETERLAGMGTWTWNIETDAMSWSPQLHQILGYDPERVAPSVARFFAAAHPDDRERLRAECARSLQTGFAPRVDYRVLRSDGSVRYATLTGVKCLDEQGPVRRMVGAVLDQTPARETDQANHRAVEQLEEALALGRLGSWHMDLATGKLSWSKEFTRILGLPANTVPSEELFFARVHKDDRSRFETAHLQAIATGESREAEGRIIRPGGEGRQVRITGVARRDLDGGLESLRGTVQDVTEAVRLREDLAKVQKMEAVGRLAGGIAHDFNNLLTVITANLDLVAATLAEPSAELEECARAVESASTLTRRLLTLGRKAQLFPIAVDPNELVASTLALLQRLVGDQVQIEATFGTRVPMIRVDRVEIERALINLVVNARDAQPNGGQVRLITSVRTLRGDRYVEIAVADNGPGLDEETRAHLFEPFFTTKPEGEGTGLGLATVLGTAEQHGGTVRVDTPAGGGAVFRLMLPALEGAPSAEHRPTSTPSTAASPQARTVLVIDDDPRVATVVERSLERSGHRVWVATSPDQALERWRRHAPSIDLVICDVVMAKMRGPELVHALRRTHPLPAVLFMTGYSEEAVRDTLDFPVLAKPFSVASLNAAVARIFARRATAASG